MFTPEEIARGTFLLIDKPSGYTSFDVIARIRRPLRRFSGNPKLKVGHAGTLDPMATGLLLIACGTYTKQLGSLQNLDKEYTGIITLGASTSSYDADTPVIAESDISGISEEAVRRSAEFFTGSMEQSPPPYSSVKVDGVRAYTRARRGETFATRPRKVEVHAFDILSVRMPEIQFRIACSKGTYIRSIAHAFGEKLGCGAYLSALRRTRIGTYCVEDALSVERLLQILDRPQEIS